MMPNSIIILWNNEGDEDYNEKLKFGETSKKLLMSLILCFVALSN